MNTEPDNDTDELEVEYIPTEPIVLMDDSCWVADPDALHHEEGGTVLAVLYRGGGLWYLDGETRQWFSAEKDGAKKAA